MRSQPVGEKIDFTNHVAVVTGGAQGIGKAIAESFAASGSDIAVVDVQGDVASETARSLENSYGCTAIGVQCDVSSYEAVTSMVETVLAEFDKIDILVNNAGLGTGKPSFRETTPEDWETVVGVCYTGTMNCSHAVLPHMSDRGSGVIINFASDSYKGNDPGLAVYGGAKAANVSFTKTLSKEVGDDGIRVNCVSPGTTRTPATADWIDEYEEAILESYALTRLGKPEDIADAVTFLCSDAASWITGQTLSVNGGYVRG